MNTCNFIFLPTSITWYTVFFSIKSMKEKNLFHMISNMECKSSTQYTPISLTVDRFYKIEARRVLYNHRSSHIDSQKSSWIYFIYVRYTWKDRNIVIIHFNCEIFTSKNKMSRFYSLNDAKALRRRIYGPTIILRLYHSGKVLSLNRSTHIVYRGVSWWTEQRWRINLKSNSFFKKKPF